MIKSIPFANAAAIVAVAASFVCWIATVVAPDFVFSLANSWFHMINLNAVKLSSSASFGEAVVGFISLGVFTWIVVYAFAEIYNRLVNK